MKRVLETSPVTGYQLFRFEGKRSNGTAIVYPNYYIRQPGGATINTHTDNLASAKNAVKKLAGDAVRGEKRRSDGKVLVGELLDMLLKDYEQRGNRSLVTLRGQVENSLRPFFGSMVAARVTTDDIDRWSRHWISNDYSPASLNREMAMLRRAYRLGYERNPQLVDRIPPFKMLKESSARKGFVSPEQYAALMAALPEHLRPITCVAYHTGNRKGELLQLSWDDVELDGDPPIFTLWPGETKSGQGRTLPILEGEMLNTLRALRAKWPNAKQVFVNAEGKPLIDSGIRKAWRSACKAAGVPDLLFHDLRRSAVRNLRRASVTESVAMKFSGHKTASVFRRYDITDFDDLKDAASRLKKFLVPLS
jgi:integrase